MASEYDARSRYRGEVAETYEQERGRDRQWRREAEALGRHLSAVAGDVVLDVPFGTGRFASVYLDRGVDVIGVDISPDMLAVAANDPTVKQLAPSLLEGEVERLPLGDASVDYVVSTRLLNWLPEEVRKAALGEFRRVARRGLLVQVRVREAYTVAGFVRHLARSAVLNGPDVARGFVNTARNEVAKRRGSRDTSPDRGYTTPEAGDFERLLGEHGFVLRAKERVHEDVHVLAKTIYCKTLYVCSKSSN